MFWAVKEIGMNILPLLSLAAVIVSISKIRMAHSKLFMAVNVNHINIGMELIKRNNEA